MRFRPTVSLSAVAALLITPPAGAQRLVQAERAWSRPSARRHASAPVPTMAPPPTAYELYSQTMMWGSASAGAFALAGMTVDATVCQQRGSDDEYFIFPPCFLPMEAGTQIGWFGGAAFGATLSASRVARARGCPRRAAWWRAIGGALLGTVPGALVVAGKPEMYPPRVSALIIGAPLLSGVGASTAVVGCRGPSTAVAAGGRRPR